MPWHLPEDFAFFKRDHDGPPDGHGPQDVRVDRPGAARAPHDRRDPSAATGSHAERRAAHSFAEALALAGPADEVFVCGGGQIYAEAMPWATGCSITEVDQSPEGDVRFPTSTRTCGTRSAREPRDGFSWVTYQRVRR